jgi:hypothetical protein
MTEKVTILPETSFLDDNPGTRRINAPYFTEGVFNEEDSKCQPLTVGKYDHQAKSMVKYESNTALTELSKYGPTVFLYLDYHRAMAVVFAVLLLLSAGQVYYNYKGNTHIT